MQIAILAGGLGTRMRPTTESIPKSMIMINDRPFLWYQLELLKKHQILDVVLCVGYLANQIEDYFGDGDKLGMRIDYSYENEPLGTAGALKNAERLLDEEFLVMNGDSYLMFDYTEIIEYFQERSKLALMTVYGNHNNYEVSNVIVDGDLVKLYDRKTRLPEMIYVDAGLYLFNREVIELIPADRKCMLDDTFVKLAEMREFLAYEVKQRFYEVGSFGGLEGFKELVGERK